MHSAMAQEQEAFMNWDQIQVSWQQLKEKFVFQWVRVTDDNYKGLELIGAEMSSGRPKRRAAEGVSPRRPRKAERILAAHWQLIQLATQI